MPSTGLVALASTAACQSWYRPFPLALSKLVETRAVPSGAPVLLFGFGGGLTYAGQVVRCP